MNLSNEDKEEIRKQQRGDRQQSKICVKYKSKDSPIIIHKKVRVKTDMCRYDSSIPNEMNMATIIHDADRL